MCLTESSKYERRGKGFKKSKIIRVLGKVGEGKYFEEWLGEK